MEDYREAALAEPHLARLQGLCDDLLYLRALEVVGLAARLDLREVEYVVDELRKSPALGLYVLAVLAYLRAVCDAAQFHELAEDAYGGERRAKLVRDVRDEVGLHLRQTHLARGRAKRQNDSADQNRRHQKREREAVVEVQVRPLLRRHVAAAYADLVVVEVGQVGLYLVVLTARLLRAKYGTVALVVGRDDDVRVRAVGEKLRQRLLDLRGQYDLAEVYGVEDHARRADDLRVLVDGFDEDEVVRVVILHPDHRLLGGHALFSHQPQRGRCELHGARLRRRNVVNPHGRVLRVQEERLLLAARLEGRDEESLPTLDLADWEQ